MIKAIEGPTLHFVRSLAAWHKHCFRSQVDVPTKKLSSLLGRQLHGAVADQGVIEASVVGRSILHLHASFVRHVAIFSTLAVRWTSDLELYTQDRLLVSFACNRRFWSWLLPLLKRLRLADKAKLLVTHTRVHQSLLGSWAYLALAFTRPD